MKAFILFIAFIAIGLVGYYTYKATTELKQAIVDIMEQQNKRIDMYNDSAIEREHSLQDKVEERIGTLERDAEDMKFIFGSKKK